MRICSYVYVYTEPLKISTSLAEKKIKNSHEGLLLKNYLHDSIHGRSNEDKYRKHDIHGNSRQETKCEFSWTIITQTTQR